MPSRSGTLPGARRGHVARRLRPRARRAALAFRWCRVPRAASGGARRRARVRARRVRARRRCLSVLRGQGGHVAGHDDARDYRGDAARRERRPVVRPAERRGVRSSGGGGVAPRFDAGGAVTGAVEAIFFEAGRSRAAWARVDADGERVMCCDAAAVTRLGCVYGRAVVNNASTNASVWTAEALFSGDEPRSASRPEKEAGDGGGFVSTRGAKPRFDVASDGMYELLFVSCDDVRKELPEERPERPSMPYISVAGRSVWKNPDGYLPGRARRDRRRVRRRRRRRTLGSRLGVDVRGGVKINVRDAIQPVHVVVFAYPPCGYGGVPRALRQRRAVQRKRHQARLRRFHRGDFSAARGGGRAPASSSPASGSGSPGSASGTPSRSKRRHSRWRTSRVRSCWNSTRNACWSRFTKTRGASRRLRRARRRRRGARELKWRFPSRRWTPSRCAGALGVDQDTGEARGEAPARQARTL